jgi:hypothetical protein
MFWRKLLPLNNDNEKEHWFWASGANWILRGTHSYTFWKEFLHVGQDLPYKPFGSGFIYFLHVGLMGEEASPNEKTDLSARLPGFKST